MINLKNELLQSSLDSFDINGSVECPFEGSTKLRRNFECT